MISRLSGLLLVLAALSITLPVQAHQVWAEWTGGPEAKAYFGEWEENLREGRDFLAKYATDPQSVTPNAPPKPAKLQDGFFTFPVAAGNDARLTASYMSDRGTTLSMFHARAGRSDTRGALALELVPDAANGKTFTLLLNGQPAPKQKVVVIGPPRWTKHLTTDANGKITIETPWTGQYVLEAIVEDNASGTHNGKAYTKVRHVTTLSFVTQ